MINQLSHPIVLDIWAQHGTARPFFLTTDHHIAGFPKLCARLTRDALSMAFVGHGGWLSTQFFCGWSGFCPRFGHAYVTFVGLDVSSSIPFTTMHQYIDLFPTDGTIWLRYTKCLPCLRSRAPPLARQP